jgi:hypothetical protein
MYKKIQSDLDVNRLTAGTSLVKYPIAGEPDQELDLNDKNNLLHYEIYSINSENGIADLIMPEKHFLSSSEIFGTPGVTAIVENPTLILKSINELVIDNKWWYKI